MNKIYLDDPLNIKEKNEHANTTIALALWESDRWDNSMDHAQKGGEDNEEDDEDTYTHTDEYRANDLARKKAQDDGEDDDGIGVDENEDEDPL